MTVTNLKIKFGINLRKHADIFENIQPLILGIKKNRFSSIRCLGLLYLFQGATFINFSYTENVSSTLKLLKIFRYREFAGNRF